jgi:glutathione S-transferase
MEILLSSNKFLASNTLSIADICVVNEVSQVRSVDYDISPYPRVSAWYDEVRSVPAIQESHKYIDQIAGFVKAMKAEQAAKKAEQTP